MSRYIRTTSVGVGNYGGLDRAWGFGAGWRPKFKRHDDDDGPSPEELRRRREKAAAEKKRRAERKMREHEKEAEMERRMAASERERDMKEAKKQIAKEQRQEQRQAQIQRDQQASKKLKQDIDDKYERKIDLLKSRKETRQAVAEQLRRIPAVVGPAVIGHPVMARGQMMPMPMQMQMQMPRHRAMARPRGPVAPPIITSQQARLGTIAAALASAMLLF